MIRRRGEAKVRAVVAGLTCAGLLFSMVCGCHSTRHQAAPTTSTTSATTTKTPTTSATAAPSVQIAPLPVRPVNKSQPAGPQKCPTTDPNHPVAPTDAFTACDIGRTTLYTLGPETMRLGLIHVDPPKSLTAGFYDVTLILDPPSASAWASYTAGHLKDHVAFVRDDLVLEAPIIEDPVTSGRIAMTTQTAEGAAQLAQLAGRPG
ncbi:preprotein translocase subunit SecD [Mycobacterium sp. E1715]|uniref:SecDF P1 head subdomain-containing protein n=1 Tax=unclassified Mycobacterium TaxID=2642494 RepID=UPI000800CAAF|nr:MULTISPECIES: preprotein translocase subunit SecD [unclassified Mycobacterium]OBG79486.1 preprotein translocase subunit SecD [Mycobacterium sp. E3305]OBH33167.1 preprotein translocase subunit SecD [Mycobacterium sp. E1715]